MSTAKFKAIAALAILALLVMVSFVFSDNSILLDNFELGQRFEAPDRTSSIIAVAPGPSVWVEHGLVMRIRGRCLIVNNLTIQPGASLEEVSKAFKGYVYSKRRNDFILWKPLFANWWLARRGVDDYELGSGDPPKGMQNP